MKILACVSGNQGTHRGLWNSGALSCINCRQFRDARRGSFSKTNGNQPLKDTSDEARLAAFESVEDLACQDSETLLHAASLARSCVLFFSRRCSNSARPSGVCILESP